MRASGCRDGDTAGHDGRREVSCVRSRPFPLKSYSLSGRECGGTGPRNGRHSFNIPGARATLIATSERLIILERGETGHPSASTDAGHASAAAGMTYGERHIRGLGSKYGPCQIPSKWELTAPRPLFLHPSFHPPSTNAEVHFNSFSKVLFEPEFLFSVENKASMLTDGGGGRGGG